ncbi:hypothetical protein [Priestia megaterium]
MKKINWKVQKREALLKGFRCGSRAFSLCKKIKVGLFNQLFCCI